MKYTEAPVPSSIDDDDLMEPETSQGGWFLNLTRDFNTEVQEYLEGK